MSSTPKDVIEELFRRGTEGDEFAIDELVAEDTVNHAAGPARQGREGWKSAVLVLPDLAVIGGRLIDAERRAILNR